jgi:hypothetical protein
MTSYDTQDIKICIYVDFAVILRNRLCSQMVGITMLKTLQIYVIRLKLDPQSYDEVTNK